LQQIELRENVAPRHNTEPGERTRVQHRFSIVAMLAVVGGLFVSTLWYGLVFDDRIQIVSNYRLTSWKYFLSYFTTHLWAHLPLTKTWYRPLFLVWLRLCYVVLGPPSSKWHLASTLAHIATTGAVFALVHRLTKDFRSAIISAGLFGVHPIHIESVAWVSAVEDPLVTLLLVLAVYFYIGRTGPMSLPSLLAAFLAMLTKEVGVMASALIFAYEWTYSSLKNAVVAALPYLLPTTLYFALRYHATGNLTSSQRYMRLSSMVLTWPRLLFTYLEHLVWPVHLSVMYNITVENRVWPLLLLIVIVAALLWRLRKAADTSICFGAAWAAITIVPALAICYFDNDFLHDRYLYTASVGLTLILGAALSRMRYTQPRLIAIGVVFFALCVISASEMRIWHDDIRLLERALEYVPNNTTVRNDLAVVYMEAHRNPEAERLLQEAIILDPRAPYLYHNLSICNEQMGNHAEANRLETIATELAAAQR